MAAVSSEIERAAQEEGYSRDVQHNPNQFWRSTGKRLWDSVMSAAGFAFDGIGIEDLEGDNSISMMSEFVIRCARSPPISPRTKQPFATSTLVDCLLTAIRELQKKFASNMQNRPELFPENEVRQWKKQLKDNQNRMLMRGDDESEILKNTFPLPQKHVHPHTNFFPANDFPEPLRARGRNTDLFSVCCYHFARESFSDNTKLVILLLAQPSELPFWLALASFSWSGASWLLPQPPVCWLPTSPCLRQT